MSRPRGWLVSFAVLSSLTFPRPHPAGAATIQCTTGDSTTATSVVVGQFHVYRPGVKGADVIWRDLEFMWGTSYPGGLSSSAQTTLRNMAHALVDSIGHNPYAAALSKIHLDYNYFSARGATYNTDNPRDSASIAVRDVRHHWECHP